MTTTFIPPTPGVMPDYTQQLAAMQMPQFAQQQRPNFIQGLSGALFPAQPGMDPRATQAAQSQALLQFGLGMMGAGSRPGATFGGSLAEGYGRASQNYTGAMDTAFRNTLVKQQSEREEREAERKEKADERAERQSAAVTAGRISTGIGSSPDPMSYWNLVKQMPEVQSTLGAYGIDPATITTPEQLQQVAQQFGAASQVAGPAQERQPLQLKSVMVDGKQMLVPEEMAVGMEPGYAPPMGSPSYSVIQQQQPDGTIKPVVFDNRSGKIVDAPGAEAYTPPVKPTGENLKASGFLTRMDSAEKLLGDYRPSLKDFTAVGSVLSGNAVMAAAANKAMSPEGQKYYQAASDWVRAKLRKESGAVIGPEEMIQEIRTYFPIPGDSKEVIKQKEAGRQTAMQAISQEAGPAQPESRMPYAIYPNDSPEAEQSELAAMEAEMRRRGLL